jgi:hypothetical protein
MGYFLLAFYFMLAVLIVGVKQPFEYDYACLDGVYFTSKGGEVILKLGFSLGF